MFSIHFKCKYWIKCETNAFRHWTTRSSVFCGESRVVGGVDIIQGSAKLAFWDRRGIMVTIIRSWFQMHQIFQIVQPRKSFEAWEVFGGNRRKVSVQERKKNLVVQRKKYGCFFFLLFFEGTPWKWVWELSCSRFILWSVFTWQGQAADRKQYCR